MFPWIDPVGLALVPNDSALTFVIVAPFLEPAYLAVNRAKSVGSSQLHPRRLMPGSAPGACQLSGGVVLDFFSSFGLEVVGPFAKLFVPELPFPLNGGPSNFS